MASKKQEAPVVPYAGIRYVFIFGSIPDGNLYLTIRPVREEDLEYWCKFRKKGTTKMTPFSLSTMAHKKGGVQVNADPGRQVYFVPAGEADLLAKDPMYAGRVSNRDWQDGEVQR